MIIPIIYFGLGEGWGGAVAESGGCGAEGEILGYTALKANPEIYEIPEMFVVLFDFLFQSSYEDFYFLLIAISDTAT